MSEDLKEEIRELKEELVAVKRQLKEMPRKEHRKAHRGLYIDVGQKIHDYVADVMEGVAEGISGELERSVFIGPHGIKVYKGKRRREEGEESVEVDPVKAASVMSALGNEYRVKILRELMSGGKYISELQEKLVDITTSTLSSHLNVLEEAGMVVQEKVRGRYLITIPGRAAYKMTNRIVRLVRKEIK